MKKTSQKIFALVLVVSVFLGTVPKRAEATFPVIDVFAKIYHVLSLSADWAGNMSLGIAGSGSFVNSAFSAAKAPCDIGHNAFDIANAAENFAGAELVVGSMARLIKIQAKISALTAVRTCYNAVLTGGDKANNLASASGIQALVAVANNKEILTQQIDDFDLRIDRYKELRAETEREMWKAVAIRVLYNVQNKITTDMVNRVVQKYKIGDINRYAQSVAATVYNVDYINNNVSDSKDQAIYRTILTNGLVEGKLLPMVRIKAQETLGFDPGSLDVNSPDYYTQLARAGLGSTNPYFLQLTAAEKANAIQQNSLALAKQEAATGGGFRPVRNCSDISGQQMQIDTKNAQLSYAVRQAEEVLSKLKASAEMKPGSVKQQDLDRAQADLEKYQSQLSALPSTNQMFVKACSSVSNPGLTVANFTNSYLQANLISNSVPNDTNLPFFVSLAEKVATNFLTKSIEGGNGSLNYLSEGGGFESGNISASQVIGSNPETQTWKNLDSGNEKNSATFVAFPVNDSNGQFTLNWNASMIPGAVSISISGPNNFTYNTANLIGNTSVNSNVTSPIFIFRVYNSAKTLITTISYAVPATNSPVELDVPDVNTIQNNLSAGANIQNDLINSGVAPTQIDTGGNTTGTVDSYQQCIASGQSETYCAGIYGLSGNGSVQGAFTSRLALPLRGMPATKSLR